MVSILSHKVALATALGLGSLAIASSPAAALIRSVPQSIPQTPPARLEVPKVESQVQQTTTAIVNTTPIPSVVPSTTQTVTSPTQVESVIPTTSPTVSPAQVEVDIKETTKAVVEDVATIGSEATTGVDVVADITRQVEVDVEETTKTVVEEVAGISSDSTTSVDVVPDITELDLTELEKEGDLDLSLEVNKSGVEVQATADLEVAALGLVDAKTCLDAEALIGRSDTHSAAVCEPEDPAAVPEPGMVLALGMVSAYACSRRLAHKRDRALGKA